MSGGLPRLPRGLTLFQRGRFARTIRSGLASLHDMTDCPHPEKVAGKTEVGVQGRATDT